MIRYFTGRIYARAFRQIAGYLLILAFVGSHTALADGGDDPGPQDETSQLEIIDAQAFTPTGPTKTNPSQVSGIKVSPDSDVVAKWHRTSVFADGTSILVFRVKNPPAGTLTFSIQHNNLDTTHFLQTAKFIGSLYPSTAANSSGTYPFPTLPAPDPTDDPSFDPGFGPTSASPSTTDPTLVYYRPPNNFLFQNSADHQEINLTVSAGGSVIASATFNLIRPTIILCHGFISNRESVRWLKDRLTTGNSIRILVLDWSGDNSSGYDVTAKYDYDRIISEHEFQRGQGVAATRMDFFGHSMGAGSIKWYASDLGPITQVRLLVPLAFSDFPGINWVGKWTYYRRDHNFGIGDIRRFISIGLPGRGSPIADTVAAEGYAQCQLIANDLGMSGNAQGVADLAVSTGAQTVLTWANVPPNSTPPISWLPLVGIAAPGKTASASLSGTKWGDLFLILSVSGATAFDLTAIGSDWVVPCTSQVNRISTAAFPPVGLNYSPVTSVTHLDEPGSPITLSRVKRALDMLYSNNHLSSYHPGCIYFNPGIGL